jgi:Coenzyme PQQ synthesis protein D (PqqD)
VDTWTARTDILFHRAGAIWLMVDPVTDKVHSLNPAAFWVWHHCDGRTSPEQLGTWLAEDAGIPIAQALADVCVGLEDLARKNLILLGESNA